MNELRYREAEQRMWKSVGVEPTEQRIHLPRIDVTVRVQEVGEGPAIVFVHGASNSGVSWSSLARDLPGFRCILLDRPGCGLSDPLKTGFDDVKRLEAFGDALVVDVLDALELDTAFVIATSYGGYIGLRGAAAHPDRISATVLLSWSLGVPIEKTPFLMRAASIPFVGRLGARMPANERTVRMIFKQIGLRGALESGRISQELIDCYVALLRETDTMRNELAAGPRIMSFFGGINESVLIGDDVLAKISNPMLCIWGEDDPQGGADSARRFVSRIPGAELELMPGVGHAPWLDDPDKVATGVRDFFARV